jgi:drug/metabolite transporter (DMT)-like permease
MRPIPRSALYALALAVPVLVALWLLIAPGTLAPSVYLLVLAVVMGLTAVTLMTVKNAQTSSSIAQLLYDTESEAAPVTAGGRRSALPPRRRL